MINLPGHTPAPAFDDPLELLHACHSRIQAQCATLRKLQAHLAAHGCDDQAQQAAQAILRYFDTAGQHHHNDEEQDLFPHLLDTRDPTASALVQRLLAEHTVMETAWQRLRPQLLAIAQEDTAVLDAKTVDDFIRAYDEHIAVENSQLLPLAGQLLTSAHLETIGRRMAARRGVAPPESISSTS
ncbi:MAG TPA: hemerythrin domain-containing protein [Gallionella sp.]|nr:hemerythrin domain-containing protein [Gallionella sp.]